MVVEASILVRELNVVMLALTAWFEVSLWRYHLIEEAESSYGAIRLLHSARFTRRERLLYILSEKVTKLRIIFAFAVSIHENSCCSERIASYLAITWS